MVSRIDDPTKSITCGGCSARWTAKGWAHCSSCHHTFSSPTLFDRHRIAYSCVHPTSVQTGRGEQVMFLRDDGCWHPPAVDGPGWW